MNFTENKNISRGKKWRALLFAFFVVSFFSFSGDVAHAGHCYCWQPVRDSSGINIINKLKDSKTVFDNIADDAACNSKCVTTSSHYFFSQSADEVKGNDVANYRMTTDISKDTYYNRVAQKANAYADKQQETAVCSASLSIATLDFQEAIKCLLYSVFVGMGWLLGLVATLFQWVVEPSNISGGAGLLNQPTVRDVWIMVRDTLNMVFILVLLFSAFCTVFQVEKWSLKKVWLSILINALLVNFSFPIARFFIDVSNVAMYYFLNNLFTGTGQGSGKALISSFSEQSKISTILTPTAYASATTTYMLAGIVFTFILGMTLLVLAVLFVIRLIALTMLLMFSPIGFVGNIFPEMNKLASDWWSNLFKHAFFGPVMVFMMMVAIAIMKATPDTFTQAATGNVGLGGVDANWIGSAAFFSIPIIILWTAMGISQKMGVAGADKIVGGAKKWGGKAAMFMSGGALARDTFKAYQARRKQGDAEKLSNRFGGFLGSQQDRLRASVEGVPLIGGRGAKQAKQRYQTDAATAAAAAGKLHDTTNMTEVDLKELANSSDKFERAAAMLELAARGKADANNVTAMKTQFGDGSILFNQLRNKVKAYDPTAAFSTNVNPINGEVVKFDEDRMKEHLESNQFDAKKLNAASLKNAAFIGMGMEGGHIKPEDLNDLSKKSHTHSNNIKNSLAKVLEEKEKDAAGNTLLDLAGNPIFAHQNMNNENDRNIHLAFAAATGATHTSLDTPEQRKEIFKRLDKDSAKNLTTSFVTAYAKEITENVSSGKFKDIVSNMKDDVTKRALIRLINSQSMPPTRSANTLQKMIKKDPYLSSLA